MSNDNQRHTTMVDTSSNEQSLNKDGPDLKLGPQEAINKEGFLSDYVGHTSECNSYLQQQLKQSQDESDKYCPYLSHSRDFEETTDSLDANKDSESQDIGWWDISDKILDNDAVELDCDDPKLIAELTEEPEQYVNKPRTESSKTKLMAATPIYGTASKLGPSKDDSDSKGYIDTDQIYVNPPLLADRMYLTLKRPASYELHALDVHNSNPIPFARICPDVQERVLDQVGHLDLSNLQTQECLQQYRRGLSTPCWPKEWESDRFACWNCYVSNEDVCMRWLGGVAFAVLPLIAQLRKSDVGPQDMDYWVWDGCRVDA